MAPLRDRRAAAAAAAVAAADVDVAAARVTHPGNARLALFLA